MGGGKGDYFVQCGNKPSCCWGPEAATVAEAKVLWNRRSARPEAGEEKSIPDMEIAEDIVLAWVGRKDTALAERIELAISMARADERKKYKPAVDALETLDATDHAEWPHMVHVVRNALSTLEGENRQGQGS